MTDELELLRRLRPPAAGPDSGLVADERNALMALITESAPATPDLGDRKRRRRRRWLAPIVVVASGATAAAGWAAFRADPTTTTSVACGDSIVGSSTGDPIADCAALWRQETGTEPPPLVAWEGPGGGIHVLPDGEEPPAGSSRLATSFRQVSSIIELEAELGDVSRGLASRCHTEADARRLVATQLRRLGLAEWKITATARDGDVRSVDGAAEDGVTRCPAGAGYTASIVKADAGEVEVVTGLGGPVPADAPFVALARSLTHELVDGPDAPCLTVDEAADVARDEATRLGLDEASGEVVFHLVPSADAASPTCARPTTTVGGRVEVTLRAVPR